MDAEAFAKLLPEYPPEALRVWADEYQEDELGASAYTVFHCERVEELPRLEYLMDNVTRGKKVWATECVCTACGGEWITQKGTGPDSFFVVEGEDGCTYASEINGSQEDMGLFYVEVAEGDGLLCPCCGSETRVINRKTIRHGRTKRLQVAELRNIGKYTTIIYWLMERMIDKTSADVEGIPRYAYAIDEKGKVKAFTHRTYGGYAQDGPADGWRFWRNNADKWSAQYGDWGSICNRKQGTVAWMVTPTDAEMLGTTGEKTGLKRYWDLTGGYRPMGYIRMWQRCQGIENLVNAGFGELIGGIVEEVYLWGGGQAAAAGKYLDTDKVKPAELLRLRKEDYRELPRNLTKGELKSIQILRAAGDRTEIKRLMESVKGVSADMLAEEMKHCGGDLEKYLRYFQRQALSLANLGLLRDTRNFAQRLAGDRELTQEEIWPRRLQQTHDRLAATLAVQRDAQKSAALQSGFDAVLERYCGLQWTDGDLTVILPRRNEDLIQEGETLRHCVGSYGEEHAEGENIILFIRHHRRPERSYYTLNVAFDGDIPRRIQLHGYGNERHGANKQYRHHIPRKVLDFVDRWEREILRPWWVRQKKRTNKEKTA